MTARPGGHHMKGGGENEGRMGYWIEQARLDAMKHIAQGIPDPEDFASQMGLNLANALSSAVWVNNNGWRVSEGAARRLRPHGLCEYGARS